MTKGLDKTTEAAAAIADRCLCARIRMLSRMITGQFDAALRKVGVTANQLTILALAIGRGGTGLAELARDLHMERSTVTRTIARMLEHRWLTSRRGPDGRTKQLAATAAGRRKLKAALPLWADAQEALEESLGTRAATVLRGLARHTDA